MNHICWVHGLRAVFQVPQDWWRCPMGEVVATAEQVRRDEPHPRVMAWWR